MAANMSGQGTQIIVLNPTQLWKERFLEKYSESMNLRGSAIYAGVSRQTVYAALKSDTVFRERYELAKADAVDTLEESVLGRARDGVEEVIPIYYKGTKVGERVRRDFSDGLAQFWLTHHRPEVYRPASKHEHSGPNGGPIQIDQSQEKKRLITLAVQNGLNAGMSLEETLSYLSMRGVPAEALALVSGDNLIFPDISISQTDISTANTYKSNGNGHGYIDIESKSDE